MTAKPHILIVAARFYAELADTLTAGATRVLAPRVDISTLTVPGVLEIPPAISFAAEGGRYDGFVALGVVIRGETTHYEIVSETSAQGLMWLGTMRGLAIGNGIQTVENEAQAWVRVRDKDKGGGAARAVLALLEARDSKHADWAE